MVDVSKAPYSADPTGALDSTSAINAALLAGGTVYLPRGIYLISGTIWMTQPTRLVGDGPCSALKPSASFPSSQDILSVAPIGPGIGWALRDFAIAAGGARNGVALTLATGANLNLFQLSGVTIGQQTGSGLLLSNANTDGFFCSVIEKCCIYGGINLANAGDSIRIRDNTITGVTPAGGFAGIFVSQIPGAAQLVIEGNNITASGGGIWLVNCTQPKVVRNQIEQNVAYTNGLSGVDACIYVALSSDADIIGNNINGHSYVNCVRLNQTQGCLVSRNSMVCDAANGKLHGFVDATSELSCFLLDNRYYSLQQRLASGVFN